MGGEGGGRLKPWRNKAEQFALPKDSLRNLRAIFLNSPEQIKPQPESTLKNLGSNHPGLKCSISIAISIEDFNPGISISGPSWCSELICLFSLVLFRSSSPVAKCTKFVQTHSRKLPPILCENCALQCQILQSLHMFRCPRACFAQIFGDLSGLPHAQILHNFLRDVACS